jgi:hypothetical protein
MMSEITRLTVFTEKERLACIDHLSRSMFDPAYTGAHLLSDGLPPMTGFTASLNRNDAAPNWVVNVNAKILYQR